MPARGVVVVACSGGADSLALLLGLRQLCGAPGSRFPTVTLHGAHLDHGLRGAAGAADAEFVRQVCAELALPCTIGAVTEAERAQWEGSVEAAARQARYRFLRQVAEAVGAERIALGHTLDDQAETVLMHFIRGSGVDGLAGMRPLVGDLIRPMLGLRHAEARAFCEEQGYIPREDATNTDPCYTRNRVRGELLPLLATYQPQIVPTLARNAAMVAQDVALLAALTTQAWQATVSAQDASMVTLRRAGLRALDVALRQRVLRRAILLVGSPKPDAHLNADSLARLDRVIMAQTGERRVVQLSTGAQAICHLDAVTISLPV